jgi:hypothetical protein
MSTRSLLNNIWVCHYQCTSQMLDSDQTLEQDCFLSVAWTVLPASSASHCWNHWLAVVELSSAPSTSQVPGCLKCLTICIHWLRASVCTRVRHSNLCLSLAPLDLCALVTTIQHLLVGTFLLLIWMMQCPNTIVSYMKRVAVNNIWVTLMSTPAVSRRL